MRALLVSLAPAALLLTAVSPADPVAPPFRLALRAGDEVRDSDVRGKLVILNFWATWCVPCRRELADLDAFVARAGRARVAVFAIDAEVRPQARLLDRQAAAMRIPIVTAVLEGAATYHPIGNAVPSTFVVDPSGRLVLARAGALSPAEIERLLVLSLPANPEGRSGH